MRKDYTTNYHPLNKMDIEEEILAPVNFSMVETGVFRSSFPRSKNMSFLKRLKLRTVISLVPEGYPDYLLEFYQKCGTKLISRPLEGNKWPFKEIEEMELCKAVHNILDESNRPLLIHCNKGKHRTGCVIGCLRKVRGWALSAIVTEYILFSTPKSRLEDQRYIEAFDCFDVETLQLKYSGIENRESLQLQKEIQHQQELEDKEQSKHT